MTERTITGLGRRRLLGGLAAAGAMGLAGCFGDGGPGGGSSDDSTLAMAQMRPPVGFDPIVRNDIASAQVVDRVVQGLYTHNEDGTDVVPELAAGDPQRNDDDTQWTVEIDENATFQNGDPVTAEDVKYSFEAPVAEETENATEVNMIDGVEVVDERTARFHLKFPYGPFAQVLTWYVVPKSVREDDAEAFNENPVGSGPFRFDESGDDSVQLTRWDDYWGDVEPEMEAVEFATVEEPSSRVTSIVTGENDVIEGIPPSLWDRADSTDNVSIEAVEGMNYFYLAFNCNEGPTADAGVREAIDYAFSMDAAVENQVDPAGSRQYSPLPRQVAENWEMPVDEWEGIHHDKDIEQAEELLGEADVPDDWTAKIIVPPDDVREQIAITIANGIEEAGYGANVQRLDQEAFHEQYVTGSTDNYNMYIFGRPGAADPDDYLSPFFTEAAHGVTEGTFYTEIDDAVVEARRTSDRETRQQLYQEAITTMLEDRAHLPAYTMKNSFARRANVQDFAAHPIDSFTLVSDWNNVSIE